MGTLSQTTAAVGQEGQERLGYLGSLSQRDKRGWVTQGHTASNESCGRTGHKGQ